MTKHICILTKLLFTFLILIVHLTSCDFKSAEQYLIEAESLSDEGKYLEANLLLDKAIEKDNKYLGAYINRGANKAALDSFEAAIADYKMVLELDSNNTLALFNTANNYKRLEEYDSAISFYNKAFESKGGQKLYLDIAPNNFMNIGEFDVLGYAIHFERGIANYYAGNINKAFTDFNISIENNYMTAECYYWIGYIYVSIGEIDLACENFSKSKQLGDLNAEFALKEYCSQNPL